MEKKTTLKDWLERHIDEDMKSLGFTKQTTPTQKMPQGTTPTSGKITFLKEASAQKAKGCSPNRKDKPSRHT